MGKVRANATGTRGVHGEARNGQWTPEYRVWVAMRARCSKPNHPKFPRYGGRGIRVCERWQSYAAFVADVGRRPSAQHSIDRIDNDGPYEPGNVRWATPKEQARNRGATVVHALQGEALTVGEWADRAGLPRSTLRRRIEKGEPLADAMARPSRRSVAHRGLCHAAE